MLPYAADYTRKRKITQLLGQEHIHMPRLISSLVPKRIMIGQSQKIIKMNISRTGEDLSIMVNSASQILKNNRNTEETCTNYAGFSKFNKITKEGWPQIPINSYRDQFRENMIRNRMWDVFSISDPRNKEKKWDIILHQYIFPLDYVKFYIDSLQKGSKIDQYVVQKLT